MRIEPANVNQIQQAANGKFVEISADVGGVVDGLKRIDRGLGVRFAEFGNPPYWHVYHEDHEGCPHNRTGPGETTYLVTSAKAHQNGLGVWEGLDQRLVDRIMKIGHSSYDYAKELEQMDREARKRKQDAAKAKVERVGEEAAHALRKDLGVKYRGRAFVP